MSERNIIISPKTKVGELLDNFPELESVLMEMSPAFEKLKNPVLRKTVARVATLQQVAAVGKLNIDEMVNRLRKAAGQSAMETGSIESEYFSSVAPDWFDISKISRTFNASQIINSGGSPMNDILQQANLLKTGEILELITPFIPAPVIDILKTKKYRIYSVQRENAVKNYIYREV